MKTFKFSYLLACALAFGGAVAADLTVIDLQNRTAEEILPALRPLVGPDVSLSGVDYKLLVRGGREEVAKIREALAVLDRAPKQLQISVRYDGAPQSKSGDIGAGIDTRGSQVVVHGNVSTNANAGSSVSTVRVLEGNSAHISTGQSVPIVTAFIPATIHGRNNTVGFATDYRELSTGFNVLPRINGERVVLEISTQHERLTDANGGNSQVQRADTTIAGRLGEWIDLGGVSSSSEESRSSVALTGGVRRVTTQSDQRTIAVKVDLVQ